MGTGVLASVEINHISIPRSPKDHGLPVAVILFFHAPYRARIHDGSSEQPHPSPRPWP